MRDVRVRVSKLGDCTETRTLTTQLSRAPKEGQEVIVIEAPDPMGPSGLKPIHRLHYPHDANVSPE